MYPLTHLILCKEFRDFVYSTFRNHGVNSKYKRSNSRQCFIEIMLDLPHFFCNHNVLRNSEFIIPSLNIYAVFCISINSTIASLAKDNMALSWSEVKLPSSAVPCTSIKFPCSFMTTFISVSATTSSA